MLCDVRFGVDLSWSLLSIESSLSLSWLNPSQRRQSMGKAYADVSFPIRKMWPLSKI